MAVRLDRLTESDAASLTRMMSDWRVAQWLTAPPWPYNQQDATAFIAGQTPADYAIRVDDQLAGTIRVSERLGIAIAPAFHRQGVGLRAAVLALSRWFSQGHSTCTASYLLGNEASKRLLTKLGFVEVGRGQVYSTPQQREVDAVHMVLTRDAFAQRHSIRIQTERLLIDGFRPDDLPDLHRIVTQSRIASMLLLFDTRMSPASVAAILNTGALVPPMRLVARHQGRVIGSVGMGDGPEPLIFYFLDPDYIGQGFGLEMVAAFLAEIKARFAPKALLAEVFLDNHASRRLLEQLGFILIREKDLASRGRTTPAMGADYLWIAD